MIGFGRKSYSIRLKAIDLFQVEKKVKVGQIKEQCHVEVKSAAKLIEKDPQHLVNWASQSNIQVKRCREIGSGTSVLCISAADYVKFVAEERKNDNPYAEQIMYRSGLEGIKTLIQEARELGRDYFEFDGHIVRFQIIDGEPYIKPEDLAGLLSMTVEELQSGINSEDFNRYNRSVKGWL
ncbi:hypothetical protein [Laspinema olomoucense]|uniref:hypothetical protein n=1 Tax=Laspinema olomoucense TaxID=3231600 RepID=UPI0021BA9DB3|nr:hypothetical protein [Laspinema sp. D3d]MCT7971172.1 hypothetical protein [Laspinema sp. D3d]